MYYVRTGKNKTRDREKKTSIRGLERSPTLELFLLFNSGAFPLISVSCLFLFCPRFFSSLLSLGSCSRAPVYL